MTPTPQDTRDFIIIADDKRRALFERPKEGDECLTDGEWMVALNRESFSSNPYRRHRSRAWLRIADNPMQFPCWLSDEDGYRIWTNEGNWANSLNDPGWIFWQPADPAPDAPVDEDEEAFEKWRDKSRTEHYNLKAAWQAGRDYERTKK